MVGRLALGVAVGGVLGLLSSPAGIGLGIPIVQPLVPVALAATTVLVGGLGQLWVSGVGRTRTGRAVWVPAALVGSAIGAVVLWVASPIQLALDELGWQSVVDQLIRTDGWSFPGAVGVGLAAVVAWTLRPGRDGSTPGWWGGPAPEAVVPTRGYAFAGLAAGLSGGAAVAAYRAADGPAANVEDAIRLLHAGTLGSGLVGAAVVLVLGLTRGAAGAAGGLLAGPIAALITGTVFLGTAAMFGADAAFYAPQVLGGAIASGFLCSVPAALAGAAPPLPAGRWTGLVVGGAVVVAAVTPPATLAARRSLFPGLTTLPPTSAGAGGATPPGLPVPASDPAVPRGLYAGVVARPISEGRLSVVAAARRLQAERPPPGLYAQRIRTEILPTLRRMQDSITTTSLDDPRAREVHLHVVRAVGMHLLGFEQLADAFDINDGALQQEANNWLSKGNAEWDLWAAGVLTL